MTISGTGYSWLTTMGNKIFDRISKLEIEPLSGENIEIIADTKTIHVEFDFEIKKHRGVDYDEARFNIYNPNQDSQKKLHLPYVPKYRPGHIVRFSSGYRWQSVYPQVFEGEVYRAEPVPNFENATLKYSLICNTSLEMLSRRREINLPDKTNAKDAIEQIAAQTGGKATFTEHALVALNKYFINGRSFSDNLKAVLDMLSKDTEVDFTVNADGGIVGSMPGEPLNSKAVPIPMEAITAPITRTEKGITLNTLLMPEIAPGTLIEPETESLKGYASQFTIEEITLTGDTANGTGGNAMDCMIYPPQW